MLWSVEGRTSVASEVRGGEGLARCKKIHRRWSRARPKGAGGDDGEGSGKSEGG